MNKPQGESKRPDPAKLNTTVAGGAHGRERTYAEWHRVNGQPLREKYRPS